MSKNITPGARCCRRCSTPTGIFSINDIRRILHEDIPPGLILAQDIATAKIVSCTPSETLNEALRKFTSRGLEEIPVVADDDPQQVLFMLSRRALLAQYATKLEQTKEAYATD